MSENAVAEGAQTVAPTQSGAGEGQSAGGGILAELEASEPQAAEQSAPDPWADAEFLKKLESMDFSKAPEALRRKVEAPFVADYTKKWQAVSEERKAIQAEKDRILNLALEKMRGDGVQSPSQTVQDQIRERLESGDLNAIPDLIKQEIEREVGPMRQATAMRNAIESAVRMEPLVKEREPEVAAALAADPVLQEMAKAENFKYAPYVLAGLANQIALAQARQEVEQIKAASEAEKKAYARRAIEEFKARAQGLPPSTSKAGSGGTATRGDGAMSIKDAMKDAFVKAGGTLDPFLG